VRELGLRFVGHSTVRLELAGHAVLTDPILTDRVSALRRVTRSTRQADRADVDLVLLSHLHGDHVHLPSLRLPHRHVRVVVPRGAGDWLRAKGGTLALAGLSKAPGRHGARLLTDPPHEFAAAVAALGSATGVLVTPPGEDVSLPETVRRGTR
jgi:glyoxylase-like metal-dependent hydrolase (beta-lactamase superfamily II)